MGRRKRTKNNFKPDRCLIDVIKLLLGYNPKTKYLKYTISKRPTDRALEMIDLILTSGKSIDKALSLRTSMGAISEIDKYTISKHLLDKDANLSPSLLCVYQQAINKINRQDRIGNMDNINLELFCNHEAYAAKEKLNSMIEFLEKNKPNK